MESDFSDAGNDSGRDVDEFGPDRAGPGIGEQALDKDPGGAGEVVGHNGCDPPGRIRAEMTERR